jgi:hypothetical protein
MVNEQYLHVEQLLVSDFTGDGKDDLLLVDSNGWKVFNAVGKLEAASVRVGINMAFDNTFKMLAGDFDVDGVADVISLQNNGLHVQSLVQDSLEPFIRTIPQLSDINIGDFNGDKVSDVLIYGKSLW